MSFARFYLSNRRVLPCRCSLQDTVEVGGAMFCWMLGHGALIFFWHTVKNVYSMSNSLFSSDAESCQLAPLDLHCSMQYFSSFFDHVDQDGYELAGYVLHTS